MTVFSRIDDLAFFIKNIQMGSLIHFFNPKLELDKLKYETVSMIRSAREVHTMKGLIFCYEILDLTDHINRPWDTHPGELYADYSALFELREKSRSMLIYHDPTSERISGYNDSVNRLVFFWHLSMNNGQKPIG